MRCRQSTLSLGAGRSVRRPQGFLGEVRKLAHVAHIAAHCGAVLVQG
ncbi:hypothetical protein SAMN05421881_101129 [Nitrosomonas halophila]|uniref:Uncharacterized protein n=1 Tax=Nitrosomonas halophila TaxID=44576 RepID=A0A1H3FCI3_9PROT|nr:hypothetical protein SAMN05421881_101129 [Nitrosomonas halophila]